MVRAPIDGVDPLQRKENKFKGLDTSPMLSVDTCLERLKVCHEKDGTETSLL